MTDDQKTALKQAATEQLKYPYPLGAETVYASAVLTTKGNIYASAQYFSDTYSLTLHAEQATLAHASAHGESEIVAIAITSTEVSEKLTNPCHMCKQLLYESSRRSKLPMTVILFSQQGKEEIIELEKMMSYPWPQ